MSVRLVRGAAGVGSGTPSGGQQAESRPEEGPEAHSRGRSGRRSGKRVAAGGGGGTSRGRSSSRLFPGAQRGFEPFPPFLTREDPQGARFREQLPSETETQEITEV